MRQEEYILCAAIWFDDGRIHKFQPKGIDVGIVLCGYRHNNIFTQIGGLVKERKELGIYEKEQGFLTSYNRFVGRVEAYNIAVSAGQVEPSTNNPEEELYSEQLYSQNNNVPSNKISKYTTLILLIIVTLAYLLLCRLIYLAL